MAVLGLIAIIYMAMLSLCSRRYETDDCLLFNFTHGCYYSWGVCIKCWKGIAGAVYLMIGHGLVSGALFMSVGVLYDRRKTKMIKEFGGLAHNMPVFAVVYCVILMASVGLPLTVGFIGEF